LIGPWREVNLYILIQMLRVYERLEGGLDEHDRIYFFRFFRHRFPPLLGGESLSHRLRQPILTHFDPGRIVLFRDFHRIS